MNDCPFCDISKIEAVHFDDGEVAIFEPLNPVVEGHLLVVPKQHVTDFADNPSISSRVMECAAAFVKQNNQDYEGINLITSKGIAATQSVMHLHIHLVPRKEGDGLNLPWTSKMH